MLVHQQHELLVSGPAADPQVYQAAIFSCGAALALVTWDALLTLGDEVDYIWSKSGGTHVKWIYLFSRWFGLMNQIGIQVWQSLLVVYSPALVSTCKNFYIVESVMFQLLQLSLDAILILRIWAIYQRDRRYIAATVILAFLELVPPIVTQAILIPKTAVDDACMMLDMPTATLCIGIGMIVLQSVFLCLIYRGKVLMQPAARRSKIIAVVVRDGIFVFSAVISIVLTCILYLLVNPVVINVILPWIPALLSILTPRMILNMQMAVEPTERSMPEFTTHLDAIPNNETQAASACEAGVVYEQYMDSL